MAMSFIRAFARVIDHLLRKGCAIVNENASRVEPPAGAIAEAGASKKTELWRRTCFGAGVAGRGVRVGNGEMDVSNPAISACSIV
jgi:hypothetical protein